MALGSSRTRLVFGFGEVILFALIPFLAYIGFTTLLDTRTGTFVADPIEGEPGWRALVDPTPVTAVVEVENDRITGLTVITQPGADGSGGAVVLVPGTLLVDGTPLTALDPTGAAALLGSAMRLQISDVVIMDEQGWISLLGDSSYELDVPDPIPNDADGVLLPVGANQINASLTPAFLGRLVAGNDPLALIFRRRLYWDLLIQDPPADSSHPLSAVLGAVAAGDNRIYDFPLESSDTLGPEANLVPDAVAVEFLVREIVPFPAGAGPGDRPQVRLVDRSGTADLYLLAGALGRQGIEVLEIGNASEYDNGPTELVVPIGAEQAGVNRLAVLVGAATVQAADADFDGSLTLLVGQDITVPTN
jgi:hypothetical protein